MVKHSNYWYNPSLSVIQNHITELGAQADGIVVKSVFDMTRICHENTKFIEPEKIQTLFFIMKITTKNLIATCYIMKE